MKTGGVGDIVAEDTERANGEPKAWGSVEFAGARWSPWLWGQWDTLVIVALAACLTASAGKSRPGGGGAGGEGGGGRRTRPIPSSLSPTEGKGTPRRRVASPRVFVRVG